MPRQPAFRFTHAAVIIGLAASLGAAPALAQHQSRAEEIQAAREKKKAETKPEESPKAESVLNTIKEKKIIERLATGYHGLTLVLGGLATGQGFALGPQWRRSHLAGGNLAVRASARYAFSRAYLLDTEIAFPRLAGEKARLEFYGLHRNYPRIDYYGPGPDSLKVDRTHYRLEDTLAEGRFIFTPARQLSLGVTGGMLRVNTGPGNNAPTISRTEAIFTPAQVPGLADQSDFIKTSAFAQFDYRDNPFGPRSGGNYIVRFTNFDDYDLKLHDIRQLHAEAQQYVPFFNKRRVIAFRGRVVTSFTSGASTVPFYLQPNIGGPDDLRGFRAYRFYDDHHLLMNLEYRWESFTGLEMAIFADAGKVTAQRSDLDFSDLESSVGFGLRFNVRNRTFIRIDTGFSHEGFQVWFKFNPAF
ncbi:MAG: BamA/TamA family outer membrane protein [Candidatus Acidiferrales bacterium]